MLKVNLLVNKMVCQMSITIILMCLTPLSITRQKK
ncbi:hypothetical protein LINPERPRIM_LOCUS15315 [Linum perenne]